jgi:WD40 repeat protein
MKLHCTQIALALLSVTLILGCGDFQKDSVLGDGKPGECLRSLTGHTGLVQSASISPDGRYALSGSCDKTLKLWRLKE